MGIISECAFGITDEKRVKIMKAIQTKYVGPTNTKGSRIIAKAEGVSTMIVSYDHALNLDENHNAAARLLAQKYNWINQKHNLVSGVLPDGTVAHCFVERS